MSGSANYPKRLIEVDLPHQAHLRPCPTREEHPPRAHLDAPHLVGAPSPRLLSRRHLRRPLARSSRSALPRFLPRACPRPHA